MKYQAVLDMFKALSSKDDFEGDVLNTVPIDTRYQRMQQKSYYKSKYF